MKNVGAFWFCKRWKLGQEVEETGADPKKAA